MPKRNIIANYIGQGWVAIIGIAFIPYYINFLGVEAYGVIGIYAIFTACLGLLDMGLTPMLGREMARFSGGAYGSVVIRDLLRSVELIALAILLLIFSVFYVFSDVMTRYWVKTDDLNIESISQAFIIMGFVSGVRFVEGIYRSAILGLQQHVLFNTLNVILATFRAVGAIGVLAVVSPTLSAFFIWQALVSVVSAATLSAVTYAQLPSIDRMARPSLSVLRPVWRYASGMMGITLVSLLLTQVDKIILSGTLPLSEFGTYVLASTIAAGLFFVIGPINQAIYPRMCALIARDQNVDLIRIYHLGSQMISVTAGSVAIVVAVHSETLLLLWTQNPELAKMAAPLLSILMIGNLLNGLVHIPYNAQLAFGRTRLIILINLIAICVSIPALIWLTPKYGGIAAAWIWLSISAFYVLVGVNLMHHSILESEKWRWYIHDVATPIVASICLTVALYVLWPWSINAGFDLVGLLFTLISSTVSSAFAAPAIRKKILQKIQLGTLFRPRL